MSLFTYLKGLSNRSRARFLAAVVISQCLYASLEYWLRDSYVAPDYPRWVQVPGRLTSEGRVWKEDRSLVSLGVRFTPPGTAQEQRRPVYVDRQVAEALGLRIGMPMSLMIELQPERAILREMATADGQNLFDDSLLHHVVAVQNARTERVMVLSLGLAVVSALGAVFFGWRARRTASSA